MTGGSRRQRAWVKYAPPGGESPLRDEFARVGLTWEEAGRLQRVQDRVRLRQTKPGDVKPLRDGILEVRSKGDRREIRLLFAEVDDGLVLLSLHVFVKKTPKTPPAMINKAADRLRKWQREAS